MVQVFCFDLSNTSHCFDFSFSQALMPSFWGYTYATKEMLVLTAQGWQ
jgi:hypothetical protein